MKTSWVTQKPAFRLMTAAEGRGAVSWFQEAGLCGSREEGRRLHKAKGGIKRMWRCLNAVTHRRMAENKWLNLVAQVELQWLHTMTHESNHGVGNSWLRLNDWSTSLDRYVRWWWLFILSQTGSILHWPSLLFPSHNLNKKCVSGWTLGAESVFKPCSLCFCKKLFLLCKE